MRNSRLIGYLAGNHNEEDTQPTYGSAGSGSGDNNNNDDDYNNSQIVLDIYSVDCFLTFFSKSILCVLYLYTRLVNAWILYQVQYLVVCVARLE